LGGKESLFDEGLSPFGAKESPLSEVLSPFRGKESRGEGITVGRGTITVQGKGITVQSRIGGVSLVHDAGARELFLSRPLVFFDLAAMSRFTSAAEADILLPGRPDG
jgi:hypothetical protein